MEKDEAPQLVTPASVKAIISRIEAAQLTRAQEVTAEMRKLPFCWSLMWQLGTDPRFGQDSRSGPLGSWDPWQAEFADRLVQNIHLLDLASAGQAIIKPPP